MRTSAAAVYAAGDVALARNAAAGRRLPVEHWGEALNQGAVAGARAAGGDAVWDAAPGFWSTIGDRTLKHVAWGDGYDEARMVVARRRRLHRLVRHARGPPSACSRTSATRTTSAGAS